MLPLHSSVVEGAAAKARSRPAPPDTEPEAARPRRRKYTSSSNAPRPAIPQVFRADRPTPPGIPKNGIIDVDITRSGPFGNPFPMGWFDANGKRRRQCVALHLTWLQARPPIAACELCLDDGSKLPSVYRPKQGWGDRTATDVTAAMSALRSRHPNAQAFRLVCSPSCKNRLCHGDALAIELRAFLSASES